EQMLILAGRASSAPQARKLLEDAIASGAAFGKFREMVAAQGGDVRQVDDPGLLPSASLRVPFASGAAGWVKAADARKIAFAALHLGAGRNRLEDRIDPAAGIGQLVKVGERVESGGSLCVVHANDERLVAGAMALLHEAIVLGERAGEPAPLVGEIVG